VSFSFFLGCVSHFCEAWGKYFSYSKGLRYVINLFNNSESLFSPSVEKKIWALGRGDVVTWRDVDPKALDFYFSQ
jgi:hypothetical protein